MAKADVHPGPARGRVKKRDQVGAMEEAEPAARGRGQQVDADDKFAGFAVDQFDRFGRPALAFGFRFDTQCPETAIPFGEICKPAPISRIAGACSRMRT